jgi:hypothetical protein
VIGLLIQKNIRSNSYELMALNGVQNICFMSVPSLRFGNQVLAILFHFSHLKGVIIMSRFHKVILTIVIVALLSAPAPVSAQEPNCAVYSDTLCVTNGYFDVFVQSTGLDIGTYTIRTGANHPATLSIGEPQSVLYNGYQGSPGRVSSLFGLTRLIQITLMIVGIL